MARSLKGQATNYHFGTATTLEYIKSPKNEKQSPFEVTATSIPKKEFQADPDRLVQRPAYRTRRLKFDINKTECINERNNDPMTMEDGFSLFDMPWISSLRFRSPDSYHTQEKGKAATQCVPPSFYDKDLEKWNT